MDAARSIHEAQTRYGKVMRLAPTAIITSDPATIWRLNSARSLYTRSGWYDTTRFNPSRSSVFSEMDVDAHDKRKAQLSSGFAGKGLVDLEAAVDTQILVLVGVLRDKVRAGRGQAALDIGRLLQFFQVDLITLVGLGEAWGDLPQHKDHFGYLAQGDKEFPLISVIACIPPLRGTVFSKAFSRVFGPSLVTGWLGYVLKPSRYEFADFLC